ELDAWISNEVDRRGCSTSELVADALEQMRSYPEYSPGADHDDAIASVLDWLEESWQVEIRSSLETVVMVRLPGSDSHSEFARVRDGDVSLSIPSSDKQ